MAAHPTLSEKTSSRFAPNVLAFERICQVIVLLMGARCAFAGRNLPVGADGLAYLDVARSYLRHDWHTAVNGYWWSLYSWLLAIGMWFFHPGAAPLRRFTTDGNRSGATWLLPRPFPNMASRRVTRSLASATDKKPIGRIWQRFQLWLKFGLLIPRGSGRRSRPCSRQSLARWLIPARKRWFGAPIPINPAHPGGCRCLKIPAA